MILFIVKHVKMPKLIDNFTIAILIIQLVIYLFCWYLYDDDYLVAELIKEETVQNN